MKVKDLIEKLLELDPEAEVITQSTNFELRGAEVELSRVHQYDTGKKETRTFRDAFDYEEYEKEVYSVFGGDMRVVLFS